jgi:hypothetical protein
VNVPPVPHGGVVVPRAKQEPGPLPVPRLILTLLMTGKQHWSPARITRVASLPLTKPLTFRANDETPPTLLKPAPCTTLFPHGLSKKRTSIPLNGAG